MINNGVAKISDFGTAKLLKEDQDNQTAVKGTEIYLPPEIFEKHGSNDATLNQDIFSLGIIACQIFADGKHPFPGDNIEKIIFNIKSGNYNIDYQKIEKDSVLDEIIKGLS